MSKTKSTMQPHISTIIKYLDCNPRYKDASITDLVRLKNLAILVRAEVDIVLGERAPEQCPHGLWWYREVESENPDHPVGSWSIDCEDCSPPR